MYISMMNVYISDFKIEKIVTIRNILCWEEGFKRLVNFLNAIMLAIVVNLRSNVSYGKRETGSGNRRTRERIY